MRLEEANTVTGDYLETTSMGRALLVEVCNPWSGDTETGFGREGSISLSPDDARRLAAHLVEWAASIK